MRTKLVIWGTNAKEERVLLALELLPDNNEVVMHVFSQETATDEFVKSMMDEWRDDKPVALPEDHLIVKRPLTIADSLLPEEYKVERGDVIQRAQSEWAFVVLSFKLQKAFRSEFDNFRERVDALQEFSAPMWEELKGFWDKVQNQVRERNLFREHVDQLREMSNDLFNQMKKLRQAADTHFRKVSGDNAKAFSDKLDALHAKIEEGKHLINSFEALKLLQREYHALELTRDDRNKLWDRMDAAFKLVKEKRFGAKPQEGAAQDGLSRMDNRMKGLLDAIEKMSKSIDRDEKDLQYERQRADQSDGQLESQLRQAKIAMIQDRVDSKKEKLADMVKTRTDLEARAVTFQKRAEEEQEKRRVEQAKQEIKDRIAKEIEASGKVLETKAEELTAAAKEIAATKKPAPKPAKKAASAPDVAVEASPEPEAPVAEESVPPAASATPDAPAIDTPEDVAPVTAPVAALEEETEAVVAEETVVEEIAGLEGSDSDEIAEADDSAKEEE